MWRSNCELGPVKAAVETETKEKDEMELATTISDDGDSSKENSLIVDGQNHLLLLSSSSTPPNAIKTAGSGITTTSSSPWGHTLTPKSGQVICGIAHDHSKLSTRTVMASSTSPNMSLSPSKQNVTWNDLSFAAEVLSPGFTGRVVRAAQATSPRSPRVSRRQYPTAQERLVRAGVIPNVRLGGHPKPVLTPRRAQTSLIPLCRPPSAFSPSLSSDFLSSATPRMPDIRSVASVLEPVSTSSECVRDPTCVQAVVAALQQAQAGKGVKRGSCYMEAEDLSKRQRCNTPGPGVSTTMPVNYSRDYIEENQSHGSNGNTNNGGEKRALDLSPTQGNPQQISPENKRRCVSDPMQASLSSSKYLDFTRLQASGRDTPYSMYDSRHDTDSESNRSVDSGQSKNSEQSLHHQTSEATGGDSCVISPGPSERDLSDRSGSHTPQSTRGESWNSVVGGNGGTTNTSRTSTPRNPTPPHHNHIITLEAHKADKTKSQQRLKKMLGMLFHVDENEERPSSKSGSSTPVPSITSTKNVVEVVSVSSASDQENAGLSATPTVSITPKTVESSTPSSTIQTTDTESNKSEVTASYTFSLKPSLSSNTEKTTADSEVKAKEPSEGAAEPNNNVSVSAVLKLPSTTRNDTSTSAFTFSGSSTLTQTDAPTTSVETGKTSTLVDFLKTTTPTKTSLAVSETVAANPLLLSRLSMPSQTTLTPPTPISATGTFPSQTLTSAAGGKGSLGFALVEKVSNAPVSNTSTSGGFNFTATQPLSPNETTFNFGVSSASNILPSSNISSDATTTPSKTSTLPFTFGSNNADKLPSLTTATSTGASLISSNKTAASGLADNFSFGSNPVVSLPSSASFKSSETLPIALPAGSSFKSSETVPTSVSVPSAESSGANLGGIGAVNTTSLPQSDLFTFGSTKTTTATTNAPPGYPTAANNALGNPSSNMMFFGATQAATVPVASTVSSQMTTPSSASFGAAPSAPTGYSTGMTFGISAANTTSSIAAPMPNVAPVSSVAANLQPPFNFGQSSTSQPAASTATLSFNFPSTTTQTSGSPSIFQFGPPTTAAATAAPDNKTITSPLFPSNVVSSQSSTSASSQFTFGSAGTMTAPSSNSAAAPSQFTFGAPKTDNLPAAPTFGSGTEASAKATPQSGFTFGSTPAATTNSFNTLSATTTNTSSAPSAGFNFTASASPASGFSFGTSNKPQPTSTTSPFAFGNSAAKAPSFGTPKVSTASPFSFGSSTAPTAAFGSNASQGFGTQTTSASTFGTTTSSFGSGTGPQTTSASTFGTPTPSFGSGTASAASPFGSANAFGATSTPPAFGSSSFGAAAAAAAAAAPPPPANGKSGSTPNPFGTQPGSLAFGASSNSTPAVPNYAPSNPAPAAPTFGAQSNTTPAAPTFGTPSSTTPAVPTFGPQSNTTPAVPTFGAQSNATSAIPTFGAQSNTNPAVPTFGAQSNTTAAAPTFGATGTATPAAPSFGTPSSAVSAQGFGSSATPASGGFGASATPSFGSSFGTTSTTTGSNSATSPFQFGQGGANPPTFGLGGTNSPGGAVFQFGTASPSPFNAGNPGTGAPRRPRNRASRRHR